jgi:hypothetical protein
LLWVLAGLGKFGVGLVPENTNLSLHLLTAFNIPVESVAMLLVGVAILSAHRWLGILGIGLAVLGLAGTLLGIAGEAAGPAFFLGLGVGGVERVAEYPGTLWRMVFGAAAALAMTRSSGSVQHTRWLGSQHDREVPAQTLVNGASRPSGGTPQV